MRKMGQFWFFPRILLGLLIFVVSASVIIGCLAVGYYDSFFDKRARTEEVSNQKVLESMLKSEDISHYGKTDSEISAIADAYNSSVSLMGLKVNADYFVSDIEKSLKRDIDFNAKKSCDNIDSILICCTDKYSTRIIISAVLCIDRLNGNCTVTVLPSYMLVYDDVLQTERLSTVYLYRGVEGVSETVSSMLGLSFSYSIETHISDAANLISAADTDFGMEILLKKTGFEIVYDKDKELSFKNADDALRLFSSCTDNDFTSTDFTVVALRAVKPILNGITQITPASFETSQNVIYENGSGMLSDFRAVRARIG